MLLALCLGALNVGTIVGATLRYPVAIAVALYCGGLALRSGWGPVETFAAGMLAGIVTNAALLLALEAPNVAIRSSAMLFTCSASLWVGVQMLEAAHLVLR
ncbi:MAG: hypothetical protein ABL864_10615 [Terricaulis sp.]